MARQQPRSSVVIPARTSSANAQSVEQPRPRSTGRNDVRSNSKAQKILGTMELPMDNRWSRMDDRNLPQRQSVMRSGDSTTRTERNGNLQPPFSPTEYASSPNLRVRASSPLLGQSYRDRGPSFSSVQPLPTKPIHPSESTTSLRSGYSSKDTSATYFNRTPALPTGRSDDKSEKVTENEPTKGNKTPKTPTKESKRKGRPPRIDLSLLFPKPKSSAAPLLSPQRMVDSPSPVSAGSESSMGKAKRDKFYSFGSRLSKTPPRSSGSWKEKQATVRQLDPIPPLPTAKHTDWYDSPVEKTICCSGGDLTVEIHEREEKKEQKEQEESPAPVTTDRERQNPPKHRFSTMPSMRQPKPSDRSKRMSSNSSLTARSNDTHLSPKPVNNLSNTIKSSLETWQSDGRLGSSAGTTGSGALSKKSGKSTFTDADLQYSSILCLSSSEDEDEDEEEETVPQKSSTDATFRSSVATYGEHEPEICTASTVQAAKGPTLTRIQKPSSTLREPRQPRRNQSVRRDPSASPYSRSSRLSRPPSGIPTISEPENEETEDEVPMMRPTRSRSNRRSRVISVTRQEEFLLEAIRQRKGKVTPSLFHEASFASRDSDRNSTLSVNPRESTYNADTSFLRLSPGTPAFPEASASGDPSVADTEKEGSLTHSTSSDTEQRTDNSTVSPRASLIYSDTLPSPSTSRASPITPTLPIHRFSPPPLHPPPSYALPPVPESHSQRRHSRRRTDSSEAIIVNEGEDSKQEDEFPIWALGWNERSSMTIVH